jgi:hypothetical protein
MVGSTLGVYSFALIFVSARTNERHHHQRDSAEKSYSKVAGALSDSLFPLLFITTKLFAMFQCLF